MFNRFASLIILSAAIAVPSLASADEDDYCPIVWGETSCQNGDYDLQAPGEETILCRPCCLDLYCQAPHQPPSQLSMSCSGSDGQFRCEAWPKSANEQLTYDWFATGGVTIEASRGPSTSPYQQVSCDPNSKQRNAFVSVVVTSPYGLSSTHFVSLSCS